MITFHKCQTIVGLTPGKPNMIKLCEAPATHRGESTRRYYCEHHAGVWQFMEASTLIKPRRVSKCE